METALEVFGAASSIRHFDGEDWCARAFPFPKAVSRSDRTGVQDRLIGDRLGLRWTGPVRISLIRWSSSLAERSESSPAPFRCFLVWTPPLAPQPLANCAQPPPLLPPCIGSQSEIRFGPSIALASEFRWAELASGCPGKPVHQSCVFHEDG